MHTFKKFCLLTAFFLGSNIAALAGIGFHFSIGGPCFVPCAPVYCPPPPPPCAVYYPAPYYPAYPMAYPVYPAPAWQYSVNYYHQAAPCQTTCSNPKRRAYPEDCEETDECRRPHRRCRKGWDRD